MKWLRLSLLVMGGCLAFQSLAADETDSASQDVSAIYGQWRLWGRQAPYRSSVAG